MRKLKNNRRSKTFPAILAIIVTGIIAYSCHSGLQKTAPCIQNGRIDTGDWEFEKDGIIDLTGDWKFTWMRDDPDFTGTDYDDSAWENFKVPGNWNDRTGERFGYCWLRLRLKSNSKTPIGLYCKMSLTSSVFYVNGKKIAESGKAGDTRKGSVPRFLPVIIPLPPDTREYVISWKISNFINNFGGPSHSLKLGTMNQLTRHLCMDIFQYAVILGILFMMSCYHFVLWLERKSDRASLYFFVFCIICFVRYLNLKIDVILPATLPHIFSVRLKLEGISVIWAFPVFILYVKELYTIRWPAVFRNTVRAGLIFIVLETIYILIVPAWIVAGMVFAFYFTIAIYCGYIFYILMKARRTAQKEFPYIFGGYLIFLFFIVYNVVTVFIRSLPSNPDSVHYGNIVFLVLQSIILSKRFSRAFKTAEYLSLNLKKEVEARTKELHSINTQLKEKDRYKTEFFQNITHELRTPLTLILGPLENLMNTTSGLPEKAAGLISGARRNAYHLLNIINQVLDLSRIDAGRMQLSPEYFDFSSLMASIRSSFSSLASSRNMNWTVNVPGGPVSVYSDRNKILRILSNLLSNAFKFTPDGGSICLETAFPFAPETYRTKPHVRPHTSGTPDEMSTGLLKIVISDNGIGIPEKELPFIFERFRQADGSSTRRYSGTGIGLSIVKEYIGLLGGSISVQSAPGKGTTFTILLPAFRRPAEEKENAKAGSAVQSGSLHTADGGASDGGIDCVLKPEGGPVYDHHRYYEDAVFVHPFITPETGARHDAVESGGSSLSPGKTTEAAKKNILLVEDNEELLSYLGETIGTRYNVVTARNGKTALETLKSMRHPPDVIVSDIMMPVMDGWEFHRTVAEIREYLHVPFLFLTARVDDKLRGLSLGAVDYICKPFLIDEVVHKIDSLVKLKDHQKRADTIQLRERLFRFFLDGDGEEETHTEIFDERCRLYNITEKEKQIILLVRQGYADKEIADRLNVSPHTVNTHLKNIYKKCRSNCRIDMLNKFTHN
ncbi:MAG: response regulator [Spirochaetales bacterium]|nr:response regulator [Spirochaetales bacterium]